MILLMAGIPTNTAEGRRVNFGTTPRHLARACRLMTMVALV